ncbi:hypothetical protein [Spiroplasma endosymbiont of Nomada ruficornis]|uniref:hypothetical protein n=1 Tax=Spiroplasma endosymbiont of Nomada ruficornis TaxID=3066325 RepID=UPI00313D3F50
MQRYDSLNLVDTQNLNSAINITIKNINDKCKKDINYTVNEKNYNYKYELLKIFSNTDNLLKTNNQYEQYLNQSNNCQKNKLGISFPMNYNGVYFPWWGFGDYFYWYMSSNTVKKIQQYLAYGQASFVLAVNSILLASGIGSPLIPLVDACLLTFTASWYMDNVSSYDNGKGVYLGISILPAPTIFEVGSQDKYISEVNSFEVDYKFLAADYITTCIDEQGVNFLLNYYNKNNNDNFADNVINPYLKQLTPVDHTGAGGSITNQDYTDWSNDFVQNDPFWTNNVYHSHLKDFVFYHLNFRSIDIRTQRGDTYSHDPSLGPYPDKDIYREYSNTWEIWKNS